MKLLEIRIQDFWCIEDSETFSLDPVTCLVGKNESGKTAILKALHKFKPDTGKIEEFKPDRDYPKRKWRPDSIIPEEPFAIETKWKLEKQDIVHIEELFGKDILKKDIITVTKGYDNVRKYSVDFDESNILRSLINESSLTEEEKIPLKNVNDIIQVTDILKENEERNDAQEQLLQKLLTQSHEGIKSPLISKLDEMLPSFLYFNQYLRLPGIISVNQLIEKKQKNSLTDDDRIFFALLSLAGTEIETIHSASTFEAFNSALRAVSNQISDQIFQYWTQNKHLDVEIRLDQARPGDDPPYNTGHIFRIRVNNRRHRADTSFDDRSSGFVWFFSFLVWFYRLKDIYGKNLIILLDEPGLTLHARAQADLLRYINEQLKPYYQVIYTTHSPFMIDPDNILSARTVEDVVQIDKATNNEILLGTKVSKDVLSTDPDTISPLQRALDYELTQTLFIGRHTLLVEGASDLLYIKWFSKQIELEGGEGLDYRWTISCVGGIDRIPGFISLFRGNSLHIAALIDVQHGQKQKAENAQKALEKNHLLTADKYSGKKEADIEDILGEEFYFALVSCAYNLQSNQKLVYDPSSPVTKRVVEITSEHFKILPPQFDEFNHFTPAEFLYHENCNGAKLPGYEKSKNNMGKLITDLNKLLKK